ncbi:hypothetical protein LVD15_19000 [Fulvivirga maritima]|uniref:hypothetical protein n=1 Tax=Fulvivirga maritima TaxID=2904247 RepID=UPI001F219A37|nr:hypothetical protein [Fulvivirga maritima]UII25374.1 hypothetical protein LVD15_19000 [Fulvivirga maritima]
MRGGLGFTYFIKENLGVEAILAYENLSIDYGSGQAIALDEVEYSGVALNIGFQVYL